MDLSKIPDELRSLRRFINWRPIADKKVPIGRSGSGAWTAPSNWMTLQEAMTTKLPIGIVLGGSISGIDLDDCFKPDGTLHPTAEDIIKDHCSNSYCEKSPSGRGLKIFGKSNLPGIELQFDANGSPKVGKTFTPDKSFFALTGASLNGSTLKNIDQALQFWPEAKNEKPKGAALPEVIADGGRNETLFKHASRLRAMGHDEAEILTALKGLNQRLCNPPLGDREVEVIAKSSCKYAVNTGAVNAEDPYPATESGDAEYFAALYADSVRFDHARRRWLKFQGGIWKQQSAGEIEYLALLSMRKRQALAVGEQKRLNWMAGGESASRRRHLLELATMEPAIRDDGAKWDADPMLIGTPGGVVDMRTGALREGRPEDRVTKLTRARWDTGAKSELWEATLEHALPDPSVRRFIRMMAGLTLAGATGENILPVIYGVTRSSKGTVLDALRSAFGDYAATADLSTFAAKKNSDGSAARPDLVALIGARLCAVYEAGRHFRLDTALMKTLSGSDPIKARTLYEIPIEFRPTFLVWVATDTRPTVPEDDDAFFERLCEVPFNVYLKPEERDKTVRERLSGDEHGAAVLAWAWAGWLDYQKDGLVRPEAVKRAVEDYRAEMDPVRPFIAECLTIQQGANAPWTPTAALRMKYEIWCRETGERPVNHKRFAAALLARGCKPETRAHARGWLGVSAENAADEAGDLF